MVKISKLTAILVMCTLACGMTVSAEETIPAESLTISLSDTMIIGETQKIKVSVLPSRASDYELEYISSDDTVAKAAIGTVIANAEGIADITVKIKDTDLSDTVRVKVVKTKDIPVTDIELSDDELYLERYSERKIYYDVVPEKATNKEVKFTSMNTSVATVTDSGIVYGKRNGSTKIKLESADGNVTKYVYVKVSDDYDDSDYSGENDIAVRRVDIYDGEDEVKKTVEIMRTQTKQFSVQIYPEGATDKRIRWKTEDDDVADVDENGIVTGIGEGTVKIYAISRDNGRQDTITVKIIPYVRYPDSITIAPQENAIFETGQKIKFTPTFSPEDTTERNLRWYVYGGCGSIDSMGNVAINDKGTVTVKAYTSDFKQSAVYEFQSEYSENHFAQVGTAYNLKQNRAIVLKFDADVNIASAKANIFAGTDAAGNESRNEISIEVVGNKIIIAPSSAWSISDNFVFIKENLCDIYGNKLGKNLKYNMKVRGAGNGEI
ncbi:MAG: Bacterial Ig-like domain (group 2) [Firmicutes bacterium ADurb.Bin193]|nr:MAG: Bacterial Ig-like domain (group 2) [Firmicutes bacterium ADurb.Bin193]